MLVGFVDQALALTRTASYHGMVWDGLFAGSASGVEVAAKVHKNTLCQN